MNRLSKKGLSLALVVSLGSLSLVGCGELPGQTIGADATQSRAASVDATSTQLAKAFAAQLQQQGVKARVSGSVVTLDSADGTPVSYDFSKTPATGKVTFKAGEIVSEVVYQKDAIGAQMMPWGLVWTAVKMVYGGAKAWWWYTHSHTGPDFNKGDLVKAIMYGIIKEAVGGLPVGFLWQRLLPIVWKWVTGEDPIRPTMVSIFETMKGSVNDIAGILQEGERLQKLGALN